jgi:hypothetical protein
MYAEDGIDVDGIGADGIDADGIDADGIACQIRSPLSYAHLRASENVVLPHLRISSTKFVSSVAGSITTVEYRDSVAFRPATAAHDLPAPTA